MVGNINQGCLFIYAHRRQRLGDEIAAARRRARENPTDLGAHQELASLLASQEALHREAALAGVRIPSRYQDPFD